MTTDPFTGSHTFLLAAARFLLASDGTYKLQIVNSKRHVWVAMEIEPKLALKMITEMGIPCDAEAIEGEDEEAAG